jgi:hypothetical protein
VYVITVTKPIGGTFTITSTDSLEDAKSIVKRLEDMPKSTKSDYNIVEVD